MSNWDKPKNLVLIQLGYQYFLIPESAAHELASAAMQGNIRMANQEYIKSKYVYSAGDRADFNIPAKEIQTEQEVAEQKQQDEMEKLKKRIAELELKEKEEIF